MRKTIVKTALITLGVVLTLIILTFTVFSLFFPKVMLNLTSDMGLDGFALTYSEQQYKNSKSLNDLEDLLYRANELNRTDIIVAYSLDMIDSDKFEEFSNSRSNTGDLSYKSYVIGNYLLALKDNNESYSVVVQKAKTYFLEFYNEYEKYNPLNILVINTVSTETENKQILKTELLALTPTYSCSLLTNDIAHIS
jgi:hypothetical protein